MFMCYHITAEYCNQTIMPNVIADTMFLHERGAYNTLYFAFYFGSLMVSSTTNCATASLISIRSDQ